MVWFHNIGVHVKLALFFISILTELAHSLFDFTFRYTTFSERMDQSCSWCIIHKKSQGQKVCVCVCVYICVYMCIHINVYSYMYIIHMYIYMYMYIIYIYIYFFLIPVVVLLAVWWLVQGLLMFWITFHLKFPPLVLDLFLAFKLIMLSPSSRAASCHFWVLYPLRLRRHTPQASQLDVLWLLARQAPWGLLGWFLNVTSSRYRTSYILGLFNKRSFRRQIDNLSRCFFGGFGVMLFIPMY